MGNSPLAGSQTSTPSKIDPNQIPRPMPGSSIIIFETRQGNQANIPPPSSSDFIVKDTGNCSPRLMRCTLNQVPCTGDLLETSCMPLALMVQPLSLPHPSEEPIHVVDLGESGPLRCSRCKGYINPFMRFVDQGRRFICNLCGYTDETPRDYFCNLGPDGRRRDADERPELCRGTVEFVATKEYMVRDPMPAAFFFLVDVSMNSIQTGATAAACSAIGQAIADLPEGPRTMVGIATFDSAIHFYNLKRALQQPMMLIVPDIQDVYTPLHTDIIVPVAECRQHLEQLLESIPTMFEENKVADSAFGAAIKAAFLALKPTGGKLLVFQSVLPSAGLGSLSLREAEGRTNISAGEKEAHKLLQPADNTLKTMAIEFAEYQVCVDVFITTQTFIDLSSISVVPRTTGGQVYYYYPFSALSDTAKLYNDLRWNISRPQGFEAVMRVRCSQGIQVQEYSGNFCKRIPTDIDLPGIDCDKTIMVTFKHDDKFQEGLECAFQCALLYTTVYGQRRIRVSNLSLPCTSVLSNLFRSADLDTQFACFLKQAASGIPTRSLSQVREQIMNLCISILHCYRKFCATVSSAGQLILPEALKLLPLYTLALTKGIGLRNDGRLDDRAYWVSHAGALSVPLAVPMVYPRMIPIHDLNLKEEDGSVLLSTLPLSSEHLNDEGIYLLENGEDCLIYVGNMVNPDVLQQIFGYTSVNGVSTQFVLEQFNNDLSKKLNNVINEIRRQRSSYLRMRLCRKGDPSGMLFLSNMVEDKNPGGLSYVEFLVHVHRQIQAKMA
ncbi:Protein transport protein Sec24-like CEF [Apostasia shenzhenica]|uniref:Protein transport protein Sec24-like CEF n=1 Tax=Apostasia shenzhenica TaxID=1088818 RepID=A0A2I0AFZ9_9ASPA|nr:Protein transport protein Sec24-like CEF [Apostasia shenzhenica]